MSDKTESKAKDLVAITEEISNLSKDELAELAADLGKAGLDLEKLERLAKLARKAGDLLASAISKPVAYHY